MTSGKSRDSGFGLEGSQQLWRLPVVDRVVCGLVQTSGSLLGGPWDLVVTSHWD